jgi:hypothetical protein
MLRLGVLGLAATAAVVVGCSASPPEPEGEVEAIEQESIAECSIHAVPYNGPRPLHSSRGCGFLEHGESRAFYSTGFESGLSSRRCTAPRLAGITTEYVNGAAVTRNWWGSLCPDSCSLQKHVFNFRDTAPVWARVSYASNLGECWPRPPAGKTYVIWDPDCGSGCRYGDDW